MSSGEICFDECEVPIRPRMPLEDFLTAFTPMGAFREPRMPALEKMNWPQPPPICRFGKTLCLLKTHLLISLQFSKVEPHVLSSIRMFVHPKRWKGVSFLARLRRWLTGKLIWEPMSFKSPHQQRELCERWLLAATGKTEHQQTFPWGTLTLHDLQDSHFFQINFPE